ncbi:phosphate acyltransferase PlsX [Alphaproteobacteria bacterium]|nr:phosphate acyltransferase PlsX [Alphaproteobacteria bacterium]MDC1023304.1 phosphate acyltransferase PlsX [Alphaproteobacteria bacterium]
MTKPVHISLDAMGGDNAPDIVINGAAQSKIRYPNLFFSFFGDKEKLGPLIKSSNLTDCSNLIHTNEIVDANDKPSIALRKGMKSSMGMSIQLVKSGNADAIVSAGNTGALMAMSKLILRPIDGIIRPAIAAYFPTINGESCMLDLGANIECDYKNLVQFAFMGQAFATIVMGIKNPSISLLNVGEEEQKGLDYIKDASKILFSLSDQINYKGFIEGDKIAKGLSDVIIADGFSGNISLKTAEGTAQLVTSYLKDALSSSLSSKIGYFFAKKAINNFKLQMDPRKYNGAVFLGLNGIAVKSHGGTDAFGFANAIGVAVDMVQYNFILDLKNKISKSNLNF